MSAHPLIADEILKSLIDRELEDLVSIRRDLHAHPELGYEEVRTSGVVRRELENAGVEWRGDLALGTGVMGHIPGGDHGSNGFAIGLRADMDALPIAEKSTLDYASRVPGKMHACGHDGHTTILIGAARVLAKISRDQGLPRPVSFLFQPAEEGGAGGRRMVEEGCLSGRVIGPPIDRMYGLHGWPLWEEGRIGSKVGPLMAAADTLEIVIRGRGGHAAMPHHTADPVIAGATLVVALQSIVSRNVDPLDPAVVSITEFHGGTAHNIIPDEVTLRGTVRTIYESTQEILRRRIETLSHEIVRGFSCEVDVNYQVGYPTTVNHPDAVSDFERVAHSLARHSKGSLANRLEHSTPIDRPIMAAEDFSFYGRSVPSCFFFLGLIPPGQADMPGLHDAKFNFNDEAMATGIEAFCRLALNISD